MYSSLNIIRMDTSTLIRRVERVSCRVKKKMQITFLIETLKERNDWENLGVDGKVRLKLVLQRRMKW